MTARILAAAAILAMGTTGVIAQTVVNDANGDGLYSIEELQVAYPDLTDEVFTEMDVDDSGAIDADELQHAREQDLIPA